MKVLVTGTEGYLGSLLAPILVEQGHEVLAVDTGFYKSGWLYHGLTVTPHTLNKDIRKIEEADLDGVHAVVHMAELSNDPAGALAPDVTHEINHRGSVRLAEMARRRGVERFVYMSSCSVYGLAADDYMTEESPLKPQSKAFTRGSLVVTPGILLRHLQDDGGARSQADGRSQFLSDLLAQRYRLRGLTTDAI